jgi:hypothetical protein
MVLKEAIERDFDFIVEDIIDGNKEIPVTD